MNLSRKTMPMRIVASALCLLALSVYFTFAPPPIFAASCTCGGGMDGQCNGKGQRCVCLLQNQECTRCVITDDRTCPCLETPPET